MPVKHYGIYLAYPPTVDLRAEGLGRHLAQFLRGAQALTDVRFCIVCPSWSLETLQALFESEQVPAGAFDIVAPVGKPYALRVFEALRAWRGRKRHPGRLQRACAALQRHGSALWQHMSAWAVAVHDPATLVGFVLHVLLLSCVVLPLVLPLVLLALPLWALVLGSRVLQVAARHGRRLLRGPWAARRKKVSALFAVPQQEGWVLRLFDEMNQQEARRMQRSIDALVGVRAWYCPTAFWPAFNAIQAPRLMCVPDVVLSEFPLGFAELGGERTLRTFEAVGRAIAGGENFLTYSETVKWRTLVDRYGVSAARVTVIAHAPNALDRHVTIRGFADPQATSRHYCQTLFMQALQRSTRPHYTAGFQNRELKFLFYASQIRPNKNVLMLLRAFEHLLRKRYLGHKLVLTGRPGDTSGVARFIADHRLENDVIFLHRLDVAELAACYKLADLAVNPSLSEGGCPFTLTEALSVGTPVVMARIAVTEEVLTEPEVQEATFFDPHNWRDCAERIAWAVNNRAALLALQQATWARLSQRSWTDVVREHVQVLDQLAAQACPQASP